MITPGSLPRASDPPLRISRTFVSSPCRHTNSTENYEYQPETSLINILFYATRTCILYPNSTQILKTTQSGMTPVGFTPRVHFSNLPILHIQISICSIIKAVEIRVRSYQTKSMIWFVPCFGPSLSVKEPESVKIVTQAVLLDNNFSTFEYCFGVICDGESDSFSVTMLLWMTVSSPIKLHHIRDR